MQEIMNPKLLKPLSELRYNLYEGFVEYDWYSTVLCNMGCISQLLLKCDSVELRNRLMIEIRNDLFGSPSWNGIVNRFEENSLDESSRKVIENLLEAGLTLGNIIEIENISSHSNYEENKRAMFIEYLDNVIFEMEESLIYL